MSAVTEVFQPLNKMGASSGFGDNLGTVTGAISGSSYVLLGLLGGGFGEAEASEFQARQAELEASAAVIEGRRQAANAASDLNKDLANRIAMAGMRGAGVSRSTTLVGPGLESNTDLAKLGGLIEHTSGRSQAHQLRRQGRSQRDQAVFSGFLQIAKTVTSMYGGGMGA